MKLNQVIAITNGKKSQVEKTFTKIYQKLGKKELFLGVDRTYRPKHDDGDVRPPEKKIVQETVANAISEVRDINADMLNLVATMDIGNTQAKADIIVDGTTIAQDVPATHLIFLEKQVEKFITFLSSLPTLDAAEEWKWNDNVGCYSSEPRETASTAKVLKHKVLYEATKEHPAQVETFTVDEIVGYWTNLSLSGNIKADDKAELLRKARNLSDAIKKAREEANMVEVSESDIGTKITDYLFG